MEGVQPPCLLLFSFILYMSISKLVYTCCVVLAPSAGAQRSRSVMPAGFHTGSNQLQWFTIAQPLNVHRVVRKNDLVPLNTKELILHSLLSGMEDC